MEQLPVHNLSRFSYCCPATRPQFDITLNMVNLRQAVAVTANLKRGHDMETKVVCVECDRVFDMFDETDAEEWFYGHDCEDA